MKYVSLPDKKKYRLPFYLAMEEYIAKCFNEPEYFFMWQVAPTVIFGRNQLLENEINIDYCRQQNIEMYRRKSGGGCVYADWSNIMFSYITRDTNVRFTFDKYIRVIAHMLGKLGVKAKASGRNDILIEGRKVSGNAFYHLPGKSIVHGTMLFNTDMEHLVRSITPSNEKLVSKGVKSVRQHVTNLSNYLTMNIEEFKAFVHTDLCNTDLLLTNSDIKNILEIEKEYLRPEFIYGKNPKYTLIHKQKTKNAGEIEVCLELKNNFIKSIDMVGDYFPISDLNNCLFPYLHNVFYNKESISKALHNIRVEEHILHLNKEQFIDLIIKE